MALISRTSPAINIKMSKPATGGGLSATSSAITFGGVGTSINRIDNLSDVVEGNPSDGDVLTYSSSDDKYYVKTLDLDGGTF